MLRYVYCTIFNLCTMFYQYSYARVACVYKRFRADLPPFFFVFLFVSAIVFHSARDLLV